MTAATEQIRKLKKAQGKHLLVLGHHYQRDAVIRHADAVGDSLELSRRAAKEKDATRIVFCGVHFMAESADILTTDEQIVYMPVPGAGCPMADMADEAGTRAAWNVLETRGGGGFLPVVYVNSTAGIKALCGSWGGSTCTSSNAAKVLHWVLKQDKRVFFLPDEHLGVNTAHDLGIADDMTAVYDPSAADGGLTDEQLRTCRVIAWKGFCHVHTEFTVNHVKKARAQDPDAKIIVHPEAPREVVDLCDAHGSTAQIIDYVASAKDGTVIYVGTEAHLVERLAARHEGRRTVKVLAHSICPNMYVTDEQSLLKLLRDWPDQNRICVPAGIAKDAQLALSRMLSI